MDIGLDGIIAVFCAGFWGAGGCASAVAVDADVDTDAASDELRESADFATGGFWLNMGRALACSTLTSVLA